MLKVYTDGGSRGNPGDSAIGVVICDKSDNILFQFAVYIGNQDTNNMAEYKAVIAASQILQENYPGENNVIFHSDSKLVVNQFNGKWRIKKLHLRKLNSRVVHNIQHLSSVKFKWVTRQHPKIMLADALLNEKLDEHLLDNML